MNIRDTLGDTAGTVIGAGGGALAGGLMGAIIAGRNRRLLGAGVGAAAGGVAGGLAGDKVDEARGRLRELRLENEAIRRRRRPGQWKDVSVNGSKTGMASGLNQRNADRLEDPDFWQKMRDLHINMGGS